MSQPERRRQIPSCLLVAVAAVLAVCCSCSAVTRAGDAAGVAVLAVEAPSGIGSVMVHFAGAGRTVDRCIVVDGSPATRLDGLPTGMVAVSAEAHFSSDCSGTAVWVSDAITVAIVAGRATTLQIVLRPNGIAIVDGTFVPEAQMSVGPHTDPSDPAIATLKTDAMTVVAYGTRDAGGQPAVLQTLQGQQAGQEDVFVPVDSQGRMLGFLSDSVSASFRFVSDATMIVHVEGAGFATDVAVQNPFTVPAVASAVATSSAVAALSAPISAARTLSLSPAGSQAVDVRVARCAVPENDGVVAVTTRSANGALRTEVANRIGDGLYQLLISLPPPDVQGIDFGEACDVLKDIADFTCKSMEVAAPAVLSACLQIGAATGPAAPLVEPACLAAFAAAETWCLMTGDQSGDVAEFVCQSLEDGLNASVAPPVYPITVSATARVPGAAALFRAASVVQLASNTSATPELSIAIDDNCGSGGSSGAGGDATSDAGSGPSGGGGAAGNGGSPNGGSAGAGGAQPTPCASPLVLCNGNCVDSTCLGASFDPTSCSCQNPTCNWGLDHLSQNFPGDGGQDQILIGVTFALCGTGSPNTSAPWIHLGTATIVPNVIPAQWALHYTVDKNASTAARQGQIGIGNRFFAVSQAAGGAACTAPTVMCNGKCVDSTCPNQVFNATTCTCQLALCTWGLDHLMQSFAKGGGNDVIRISVISTGGASCGPPTSKASAPWIHLGQAVVIPNFFPTQWTMTYTVDPNSAPPRQGSIMVEDRAFQVLEDGVVPTRTIAQTQPTMPDPANPSSDIHPLDMSLALAGVNSYDLVLNNSALFAQGTVTVWDHKTAAQVGQTSCSTVGADPIFPQSTPCTASTVISLDKSRTYDWVLRVVGGFDGSFFTTEATATVVTK